MRTHIHSEHGMSLIETMIAMLVLTVGAIGMASVFLYGMQSASSSPNELVATQKAIPFLDSKIFSAAAETTPSQEIQEITPSQAALAMTY